MPLMFTQIVYAFMSALLMKCMLGHAANQLNKTARNGFTCQ